MQHWSDDRLKGLSGGDSQDTTYDTDHGPSWCRKALDLWLTCRTAWKSTMSRATRSTRLIDWALRRGRGCGRHRAIARTEAPVALHIDHDAVEEIVERAEREDLPVNVGVWIP